MPNRRGSVSRAGGGLHPIRAFLASWLVMFALWLPYLLALWPSVWEFDTHTQTRWILDGTFSISAWHPPLHTLWLSLPVAASKALFDSYVPGAAFHSVTQMLVLSALFTKTVFIVKRWRVPQALPPIIWLVFALFPVFPFWSCAATKDVIFSGLFALSCACLADLAVNKSHPHSARHFVLLWVLLMLTALFRNNAAYAFALFAILVLLFCGKLPNGRVRPAAFIGSIVIAWAIITGPVYAALGIAPIQSKEMMSVPAQQLATTAQQEEDLTENELTFIRTYVPDYAMLQENLSDPVKDSFAFSELKADPVKFIKGYAKIGLAHPTAYLNAFFRTELAFLSPMSNVTACAWNRTESTTPAILIDEPPLAPELKNALTWFLLGETVSCIPLICSCWQGGFWLWIALLLLALCCFLRERGIAFVIVFILCYWATVCVGPVAIFRYELPLVCCAPLLVSLFLCIKASQTRKQQKEGCHCSRNAQKPEARFLRGEAD